MTQIAEPEIVEEAAPEVVEEESPEIESLVAEPTDDESTETPEPIADPLADLDEPTLREHARIKELLAETEKSVAARTTESERQKAEAKAQNDHRDRQVSEAQQAMSGAAQASFENLFRYALTDPDGIPLEGAALQRAQAAYQSIPKAIQDITNNALIHGAGLLTENWREHIKELAPDFEVGPEMTEKLDAAIRQGQVVVEGRLAREAAFMAGQAAGIAEGRKLAAKETKAEVDAAKAALVEEQRKTQAEGKPSPTGGTGGAASSTRPIDVITDTGATWEQKQAAYKEIHGEEWRP